MNYFGFRSNRFFKSCYNFLVIFYRKIETDLCVLYFVAQGSLFPCLNHIGVILQSANHFIPRLQIHPKNNGIQRFCCVSINGDFFF